MTATSRPLPPTAPPFLLSIDVAAGTVVVHGELDRRHVDRLLGAVKVLVHSPSPCWSIDVSGVSFCDACGLRSLQVAQQLASREGRTLRIARPGPWLDRLLSVAGSPA